MKTSISVSLLTLVLQTFGATTSITPQAQSVCDEIYSAAPSNLAYAPSSSKAGLNSPLLTTLFQNASTQYWNAVNDANVPACVLFPSSAQDVSAAVVALGKQPSVPFALKSGGHNWNPGFSSTNGGVLISFRPNLQGTTLASDGQTAKVGPGARWIEVMNILDKSNKCVVGGRTGDVGVGGYLLQGGISYLSAQHGFGCDSVVEYEFVTANGTILTVNENSHPDIFWALHGGGNAFGIVTMFTLRTYDIGDIWGGQMTFDQKYLSRYTAALTDFIVNNNDSKAGIIPNYFMVNLNQTNYLSLNLFYHGPNPPAEVFAAFTSIPALTNTTKIQRYPDLLDSAATTDLGLHVVNGVNSFPNLPSSNTTSFLDWQFKQGSDAPFMNPDSLKALGIVIFSMAVQPIPVGLQHANRASGGALSLDPANGDKIWIEYDIVWVGSACDTYCPDQLQQLVNHALTHHRFTYGGIEPTNYVSGDLSTVPYNPLFMNDAGGTQDVLGSFGKETYSKLKTLHGTIDPDALFTTRQNGWFFS